MSASFGLGGWTGAGAAVAAVDAPACEAEAAEDAAELFEGVTVRCPYPAELLREAAADIRFAALAAVSARTLECGLVT